MQSREFEKDRASSHLTHSKTKGTHEKEMKWRVEETCLRDPLNREKRNENETQKLRGKEVLKNCKRKKKVFGHNPL